MAFRFWKRLGVLFLFLAAAAARAAERPSVVQLVPAESWRLAKSQRLDLEAVRHWGGDPDVEREYGVKYVEHRIYQLADKIAESIVEPASDASAAYGLLTYYQTEAMTPEKGLSFVLRGPDGTLIANARFFIRLPRATENAPELSRENFRALLTLLGAAQPPAQDVASLPGPLHRTGLIRGTERYLLGEVATRKLLPSFRADLIGFSQGAEVHMAKYSNHNARVTLLVISYPTHQIARAHFEEMEKVLAMNQDRGRDSVCGKRMGPFAMLVLNCESPSAATKLMNELQASTRVTPNERYPGKSVVVQMLELIVANMILISMVSAFSVLGGILIFLSRQAAKRWFPESAWGQPDEATIVTLHLR